MSPIPTANAAGSASSSAVAPASASTDENMFLQLLVTQLQNQDPTAPMDSTTFVTQLAQFQQLESTNNMAASLSGIQTDTDQLVTDIASGAASSGNANPTT